MDALHIKKTSSTFIFQVSRRACACVFECGVWSFVGMVDLRRLVFLDALTENISAPAVVS